MATPTTGNLSTYDNVLRHVYTPKLWQLQNRDRILFQMIARDTENYAEGKQINVRLHTAGSGGVGWAAAATANPTLPVAGKQSFGSATTNYRRLYGRMKIDGPVLSATRAGYAAELKALEFEARNLVEDIADAMAYDIWQDTITTPSLGGSLGGVIGEHSTKAAGSFSIAKSGAGLRVGQIVDIHGEASTTTGTDAELTVTIVSIVTHATDSTKWDVDTDGADGDGTFDDLSGETPAGYFVYRQGSAGASKAIDGIKGIILDTGDYLGIDRATAANGFWKAQVMGNSGTNREITLPLMQEMLDLIETSSPGRCKLILCPHAIWRKVANILVPDKRYGGDIMQLNGWCEAVMFRGIPIVRDKYAPANRMYFMDTDTFKLYQDSEGGFIDNDGQILHWVVGSDSFEAAWRRFVQLVCCDPASNGVIQDINET